MSRQNNKKNIKRHRVLIKLAVAFLVISFLAVASLFGINIFVRQNVRNRFLDIDEAQDLQDVDCIVILGASVVNGDTPSPMLQDRLDKGIELYFAGCAPKIIMSGDHGGMYYDEVNVMKNYAIAHGVPSEDIFMDHAGFSTYESMYRAKEIFGAEKILVVTQEYHLYRSLYVAERMGLTAYGVPAKNIDYSGQKARDVREYLAVVKDFVKVIIKPEPTILGSPVSLSGSGDVTNDKD